MRGPLLTATAATVTAAAVVLLTRLLLATRASAATASAHCSSRRERKGGFERAEIRLERKRAAGQRKKMGLCSNTEIISQKLKILFNFYLKEQSGTVATLP